MGESVLSADGKWHALALGDLELYVKQQEKEVLSALLYQAPSLPPLCRDMDTVERLPEGVVVQERLYFDHENDILSIQLQLADKPFQVKPMTAVKIVPKGRMVLYVSTPLWIQLKSHNDQFVIVEYPLVIPRMSWVGSSTTDGSLCYSSKTTAPADLNSVKHHRHRAITALELINDSDTVLVVERLSLPLNILSLFYSEKTGYWTESVRFRIDASTGETTVVASQKPPELVEEWHQVSCPRSEGKISRFRTAMNLIMG